MLYKRKIEVIDLEFVSGHPPLPLNCTAKVRYRSEDTPCQLKAEEGKMVVEFTEAVFAPTPGQSIVFYQGSTCLGGAIIE
jgi:tRNA-specific 2-thiouridylase